VLPSFEKISRKKSAAVKAAARAAGRESSNA